RRDAQPVSLTMPLRSEPYTHMGLHPFFENLLPEGWLLEVTSRKLKVSKDDLFGLLVATCADCVGAVEIFPCTTDESE
ncbi:MAG: HipA N-terminal domain-containing protein, partial [Planctomycetaceae bacterium]